MTTKHEPLKILFFDIEATNLSANFGYMLCASWKWKGKAKVHTVKITDNKKFLQERTNDFIVAYKAIQAINEADVIVTWYGKRFDIPFVNSRALENSLTPPAPVYHVDGWEIARKFMKLNSNRLQSVLSFLGLDDKTPLNGRIWVDAMAGDKKAINYVVEHCEQDVIVLEQAFDTISCLGDKLVMLRAKYDLADSTCPYCLSDWTQARGFLYTRTARKQRHHCQSCGKWYTSSKQEKKHGL